MTDDYEQNKVINQTRHKEMNLHGILAEFDSAEDLMAATKKVRAKGYRRMEAYSPFPVEGIVEVIGHRESNLLVGVFIGGVVGALVGFLLQYGLSVIAYPYNIGGRPYNSWVSFIPIVFEVSILFASFTAVFGMIGRNGLPKPYHPVFNVERFAEASRDKFFLCLEARDENFDLKKCQTLLHQVGAKGVYVVDA